MKVNVLKKSKGFLKIEVEGEGHTFGHLMQDALLEDTPTLHQTSHNVEDER